LKDGVLALLLKGLELWAALQGVDGLLLGLGGAHTEQGLLLGQCSCSCLRVGLQEPLHRIKLAALFVYAALGRLLLGTRSLTDGFATLKCAAECAANCTANRAAKK
jgi:hypothetical protein